MLQDLAYERAILSSLCQNGLETYIDIDYITPETFTDNNNATIFNLVRNIIIRGDQPDFAGILSEAGSVGVSKIFESDKEITYIRSLFNFPVVKENVSKYAQKIAKLKIMRDAIKIFDESKSRLESLVGNEDIGSILTSIEEPVNKLVDSIYNTGNDKPILVKDVAVEYATNILNNPKGVGISSGIPAYDAAIGGGLRRGAIDVVAARTKIGKSTFGLTVALHLDSLGIPVLILDTEMDTENQLIRIFANKGNIDINKISKGDKSIASQLLNTAESLKNSKVQHKNVAGKSIDEILAIARQWIYRHVGFDEENKVKECLIVYDYLKMTSADGLSNAMKEYQVMGFQMTALHNFAVKYMVPVLAFVQLNREEEVSQSDRIQWLCTSLTKFKEKSQQEQADDFTFGVKEPYNRKLEIELSRFGPGLKDGDYINLRMRGEYSKLIVGPTRNELVTNGLNKLSSRPISETDESVD